jgi:hypothetical protein
MALQSAEGSSDWTVLHSLGIADHVRQVEGEADFVIVVQGKGVVVFDVKSHQTIDRLADVLWKLGNDAPSARGPFQQANEALLSRRALPEKKGVDQRSNPMLSAVWFTQVRARTMRPIQRPIPGCAKCCIPPKAGADVQASCIPPTKPSKAFRRRPSCSPISTIGLVPGFESLMHVGMARATDRLFAVIGTGTARMSVRGRA